MRKSLFYLTAFIVLAVGCNKENGPEDGQTGGGYRHQSISYNS